MSDIADKADEQIEAQRRAAIQAVTNRVPTALATGQCLNCDEPVEGDHRWCCASCRDDWERWNPEGY